METNRYKSAETGLGAHALQRLEGDHRRWVITCLHGALWITQEGDPGDHVVKSGDQFQVTQPGLVLVEALRDALMRVTCSTRDLAPADRREASPIALR